VNEKSSQTKLFKNLILSLQEQEMKDKRFLIGEHAGRVHRRAKKCSKSCNQQSNYNAVKQIMRQHNTGNAVARNSKYDLQYDLI
jgi:hypothetical protein